MIRDSGTFSFDGKILPYLRSCEQDSAYNHRAVEVPIALRLYNRITSTFPGSRESKVLELGDTLPHYHPNWALEKPDARAGRFPHLCVSKYSETDGVIPQDLAYWNPHKNEKYDLIVSLSYLPYLWDNYTNIITPQEKLERFWDYLVKLKSWLTKSGTMMITIPAGLPSIDYDRSWLDMFLNDLTGKSNGQTGRYRESDPTFLKKMNRMGYGMGGNKWHQVEIRASPDLPYDKAIPSPGTLFFLFWGRYWESWQ